MNNNRVETVLGPVDASDLGRTLTHEHVSLDFDKFYVAPSTELQEYFQNKINIENVGFIRQYPYSSRYNVHFYGTESDEAVLEDVKIFKKFNGGTIVENTSHGIKRNIPLMRKVSEETGVHIIAGTGYYVALTQNSINVQEEQMYDCMKRELTIGCDENANTKAGFIGEVGSSWPLEEFEIKAIRAAAQVQQELKCPVSFHPGRNSKAPFEIMRLYTEAGGNANKAIMSHLDRTLTVDSELLEFSNFKSYCQFDLFGTECSYYQLHTGTDMLSDAQRLDKIKVLKENGSLEKILMSHDIHTKHRLIKFGGHGYCHIFNNVIPKMLIKGFTMKEIDQITIENPKNWLLP